MTYCGEHCLSATDLGVKTAVSLRCKSWTCADCAPNRQRQLIAQAMGGEPNRLLTLTSRHRNDITPEQAAKDLVRAWRLIRRQIKRDNPKERVEFLAIFEATQTGWPHLHILLRSGWIDQKWISRQMARLTNSPIVDIQALKNRRGAAKYVAKYTAKGPGTFGTLKRYWSSLHYQTAAKFEKTRKALWDRQHMTLDAWCSMWESFDYQVERLSRWKATAQKKSPLLGPAPS